MRMNRNFQSILQDYGSDRTRLIDMLWDIQELYGYIPDEALSELAQGLRTSKLDIRETASFFHFFHLQPAGKYKIYLSNTVIAKMNGFAAIHAALERDTGALGFQGGLWLI